MSYLGKLTVVVSGLLLAQSALADGVAAKYLWSDASGFVPAGACSESRAADINLRVDESAAREHVLVVASEAAKKRPMMKDAADYVIEVPRNPLASNIGDSNNRLAGSFWQIEMDGDQYDILSCGPKKKVYVVFNVFVADSNLPVAQVGVSSDDMRIFRKARIHTPDEAEKAIDVKSSRNPVFNKPVASNTSVQTSPSSQPAPNAKPSTPAAPVSRPSQPTGSHQNSPQNSPQEPQPDAAASPGIPNPVTIIGAVAGSVAGAIEGAITPIISGSLEYVVCMADGGLQVRDAKLREVLFQADKLESVKPIQAFGAESQVKVINGKSYKFIKVQFPNRADGENVGWVAESFIQLKSNCEFVSQTQRPAEQTTGAITSLTDSDCCTFPMKGRTEQSYREGMRRFRAGRSHGRRIHAACDLYRPDGEGVSSVAPGTVIRGKYYFYQGVYAVEVRHAGGFVVRYGEVLGRNAPNVSEGSRLQAGQTIGYVGTVDSGCCSPMLHFELYSGNASGGLTQPWRGGFQRREDLLDPTAHLQKWERSKFGTNY